MITPDKYIHFYSCLYNRKGIHPYLFKPIRRIIRKLARKSIPIYFENNPLNLSTRKSDIIVSLTSFPSRINDVYLVIQSMLRQTITPKKIILWLSKLQFKELELPSNLSSLVGEIFNIRFVDGDIRSHKKYYYVLSEFPNDRVLIVDDDLFYPSDMIETMQNISDKYPDSIICRYGSIIKYKDGEILPYNEWWNELFKESNNQNFFFGSGGGILLKKKMLFEDALNIELATKLTPLADDIWLNAMINLAGTKKYKTYCGLIMQIQEEQEYRLAHENVYKDMNTEQLYNIIKYYKQHSLNPFSPK